MTSPRSALPPRSALTTAGHRWALSAVAFVVPAAAWWFANARAYDASTRLSRVRNDAITAYFTAKAAATGRSASFLLNDESWYATGWVQHWNASGGGLFLLAGAALLALVLRHTVRGPGWLLPPAAAAFAAGYGSFGEAALHGAAGSAVTSYTTEGPSFANQGLNLAGLHGPAWLVWPAAALGVLAMLLPAALMSSATSHARNDALAIVLPRKGILVVAALSALAILGSESLSTDGSGMTWRGPLGAALLVLAGGLVLQRAAHPARVVAPLAVATWALIVASTSISPTQLATSAWHALLLVAAAALPLLPWHALRGQVNGKPAIPAR